jgi:hypothetical protein
MIRAALAIAVLFAAAAPARADGDDALYTCKKIGDKTEVSVSFMPSTKLADLATWYMGFTCSTVVFSDAVACRAPGATLLVPEKVTGREARALFFDALEVMGLKGKVKGKKVVITEAKGKANADQPQCTGASADPVARGPSTSAAATAPTADATLDLSAIRKIDDTHFELPAATRDAILADPMTAAKGARVVPAVKDGAPDGFKLYAIKDGSIYRRLGFQNADTVQEINGTPLTSADKALEVYTTLKDATTVYVGVSRRGKPVVIEITVK